MPSSSSSSSLKKKKNTTSAMRRLSKASSSSISSASRSSSSKKSSHSRGSLKSYSSSSHKRRLTAVELMKLAPKRKDAPLKEFARHGLREAINALGMHAKNGEVRETKRLVVGAVWEALNHKLHDSRMHRIEKYAVDAKRDAEDYALAAGLSKQSEEACGKLAYEATYSAMEYMSMLI